MGVEDVNVNDLFGHGTFENGLAIDSVKSIDAFNGVVYALGDGLNGFPDGPALVQRFSEYSSAGYISLLVADGATANIETFGIEENGKHHVAVVLKSTYRYKFAIRRSLIQINALIDTNNAMTQAVDSVEDLYSQGADFMGPLEVRDFVGKFTGKSK